MVFMTFWDFSKSSMPQDIVFNRTVQQASKDAVQAFRITKVGLNFLLWVGDTFTWIPLTLRNRGEG
jgi:hypothetical protein